MRPRSEWTSKMIVRIAWDVRRKPKLSVEGKNVPDRDADLISIERLYEFCGEHRAGEVKADHSDAGE